MLELGPFQVTSYIVTRQSCRCRTYLVSHFDRQKRNPIQDSNESYESQKRESGVVKNIFTLNLL